tara:strand:- start:135 stop:377 length:243 start_codon:yes stop_codon:yes gene_type:complete
MSEAPRIILLHEIIESKVKKENELAFYQKELEKLQQKMYMVRKDIELTNIIIEIVENERVHDIKQALLENNSVQTDEDSV